MQAQPASNEMERLSLSQTAPVFAEEPSEAPDDSEAPEDSEAAADSAGDFIFSAEFPSLTLDDVCELPASGSLYADRDDEEFADCSMNGVAAISAMPVLSRVGEQFLFRKMNYLRYRASLQPASAPDGRNEPEEPTASELLADAEAVRRHLAECNLRLVASIARRFATGQSDFDELVSEGNLILLKAVDKFDYSRGFRFSTYLTYSIQRHLFRVTALRSRRKSVEVASPAEVLETTPASIPEENDLSVPPEHLQELVRRMDECLTEREQWVVREHFGLGDATVGRPFRDIAREAGLSRERVRQIQLAALRKLKAFLAQLDNERSNAAVAST